LVQFIKDISQALLSKVPSLDLLHPGLKGRLEQVFNQHINNSPVLYREILSLLGVNERETNQA